MKRLFIGAALLLGIASSVLAQSNDALSGQFSIRSNGEQVVFSRGNLCLQIENSAWYFATNQYDIIGSLNIYGGALSTPIDLYGYSGSTYNNWGVSPVNANSLFSGDFVDWGENSIGDSPAGYWRTLSYTEWSYLLNQRTNAAALRGVSTIAGQTGLVLLPDTATSSIPSNYTTTEWAEAEARGAVFLPFAGRRIRANRVDSINTRGYYWTSTTFSNDYAGLVNLGTTDINLEQTDRLYGHSVRLIHSIGIHRDSIYSISVSNDCSYSQIPDTKADALTLTLGVNGCPSQQSYLFAFRDQVILTATADECHAFVEWSDGVTDNPRTVRLTGSLTLSAIFRSTKHEIRFIDYDGTLLATDSLCEGEIPAYPGTTLPSRENTAQYEYTFVGWTPQFTAVTDDATYIATYDSTVLSYTVTFLDFDGTPLQNGSLAYGSTPAYTASDMPSREATAEYTYTFIGWTPAITTVTGDQIYTATYDSTINRYQVDFIDFDGTLLLRDSLYFGVTPAFTGATLPTRDATAQYTYTFVGWMPAFTTVTGDQVYTAVYDSTINRYQIDFVDYNGTPLQSDSLDYGAMPEYAGTTLPERDATSQYEYTFSGWTPQIASVTGNQIYTATYDSILLLYSIRFVDYDGTLLADTVLDYNEMPYYNGATLPSREATAEYSYTFIGWTPAITTVTGDQIYTATYDSTINRYQVDFLNFDGTLLLRDSLYFGVTPAFTGATLPTRDATAQYTYTFVGWMPAFTTVTGDQVYTAVYDSTINRYQIDFVDYNGTPLQSDSLDYGAMPEYAGTTLPERTATSQYEYTFSGWTPQIASVTGNQIYTATYDSISLLYSIRFVDYDGTLLADTVLGYNEMPSYNGSVLPSREATAEYTYTFLGWTPAITAVTGDQIYTATYDSTLNRYQVDFLNFDRTLLLRDSIYFGVTPAFTGATLPTRDATAQYTYTFVGWTPAFTTVTGDQVYTAVYDSTINRYQIDFVDYNGTPLQSDSLDYGAMPEYAGTTVPERDATSQYEYTFSGWTPQIASVTGDQIYTATYDSILLLYSIRFVDYDGTLLADTALDYNEMPYYNGATLPSREATAEYTYTFIGWTPAITTVTGDQIYTATYDSTLNRYQVDFIDFDGTPLQSDTLAYGMRPNYTGIEPARTATAQYTYTFIGWNPTLSPVTGDQTYTAVYDSTINRYRITYLDYDSTLLLTDSVVYGTTPVYPGNPPMREATAQFTYTFAYWTPQLTEVTDDQTYIAVFDSVINRYQIDYLDYDGTLLQSDSVAYGDTTIFADGTEPARDATAEWTYRFTGWMPQVTLVTTDARYTATYDSVRNKYQIDFVNWDDMLLEYDSLEYGQEPVYNGAEPVKEATAEWTYLFAGWTPELTTVTEDMEYQATFDSVLNRYQVTYLNFDSTLLLIDSLDYGTMPAFTGVEPVRQPTAAYTYSFAGWTPAFDLVSGNQTYTAVYDSTINRYQITYRDYDGTLLLTDSLDYGLMPAFTGAAEPVREATAEYTYTFVGWTPALDFVTGDATYTATYDSTINRYAIRYENYDSTILAIDSVAYGSLPVYSGPTPTREATAEWTYLFSHWAPALDYVTDDATYIAVYDSTINRYQVTFRDYDGTLILTDSLDYGLLPAFSGTNPTRQATAQYTYTFAGWTPEFTSIISDQVYTAVYDSILNRYPVDFFNWNGTLLQSDTLDYGTLPVYTGATPSKDATPQWTYVFSSWTPELTLVTEPATYTAVFDSIINRYTLTLTGDNATLLGAGTYEYGTVVSVEAIPDDGYHFVEWSDGEWRNPREVTITTDLSLDALIEIDCIGLTGVPVEKIYDWLLLVNVSGLEQLGYTVTENDVTWFRANGEVDDPEHRDDDELVGRGFFLKVGAAYVGFGRFYAVVDVSGSMHADDNLCTGFIRSQVVAVGVTGLDETAEAWTPYLYPAAVHPSETLNVQGLKAGHENTLRVYDLAGHQLDSYTSERGQTDYQLPAPAVPGTYLLRIEADNQHVVLRFIVLQK